MVNTTVWTIRLHLSQYSPASRVRVSCSLNPVGSATAPSNNPGLFQHRVGYSCVGLVSLFGLSNSYTTVAMIYHR